MPDSALAYFITFHTYGTWLTGNPRGSVDRLHNTYGTPILPSQPARERLYTKRMKWPAVVFEDHQRLVVDEAIRSVVQHRNWRLLAINVRTNHVHVVCHGLAKAEAMMGDFKRWSTRRLRERGLFSPDQPVWNTHGSTRYLWDQDAVAMACNYTVNRQ